MGRAFLFALAVVLSAMLTADADDTADIKEMKYVEKVTQALRLLFPVKIVEKMPGFDNPDLHNATQCSEDMKLLQQGLSKGSLWALKMVDASSKVPSGVIMGNRIDVGMFDECVSINIMESGHHVRGRHCMYNAATELMGEFPISETLSICVPASCDSEDVEALVKNRADPMAKFLLPDISLKFGGVTCTSIDLPEWTTGGIVTLTGFALLLLFLAICTICDFYAMYSEQQPAPKGTLSTLRQFSFYSNAMRLLTMKMSPQTLPAIHGLRFMSMSWVILGHAHIISYFQPIINSVDIVMWMPTWRSLHVVMAPFSVETFFSISGFLMSYLFLTDVAKTGKFNLFSYYLHRYIRLTPALIAVLLLTIHITPRLGSGPLWENSATVESQDCQEIWWTMFVYVQNYVRTTKQACMGHTWYLAVEMQFFWISPLIMYPLAKKPKLGLCILGALFIASVATPVIIGYKNHYTSAIVTGRQFSGPEYSMNQFYFVSHVRAASWLIGIFNGYLIFTYKGSPSKAVIWFGWLLTIFGFSFSIFTVRIFEAEDYEYNVVWESIYTALSRPLWGFGVSWIIHASIRGFGGPIATFLSYPIYSPLSRISYCTYLMHYPVQYMKARSTRTPFFFSTFSGFDRFLSDLVEAIILGFFLTLIVEIPFMLFEKHVKNWRKQPKNDLKKAKKIEEV